MATSVEPFPNGFHDNVLRPRPRKPVHSQLSHISNASTTTVSYLEAPESGMTSGRSTPVPPDAPPSQQVLSSAKKQVRAEQRRRIFPTIEFASRVSHFDPASEHRDFHGFFNLFWIGLAIMAITSMLRNIKDTGYPLRVEIWTLFTVKLWHLALADFFMVASTAVALPLQKSFRHAGLRGEKEKAKAKEEEDEEEDEDKKDKKKRKNKKNKNNGGGGGMTWARGGMALQSVYQAVWLCVWIALPFALDWTWTAQVFLLLHTMVLLMKMHSYAFYNGHLSETERRLRALDDPGTASRAPAYLYPSAENPGGALASPTREGGRAAAAAAARKRSSSNVSSNGGGGGGDNNNNNNKLYYDSDEDEVAQLREHLARELTSPMGNIAYPRNLTWANYADYLLCPTLCYELEYPRTAAIDWQSLVSKVVAVFGCIFILTITSEEFILPVLVESSARLESVASVSETFLILAESISWLLFPFMLTFLLVFLVIFEYVLGAFAELTRFGDRHFYSDWWNSTDWMEFSREWNVPVYSFLRRHVYSASRPHYGRTSATILTFLISAVGHEIVMACITKKLRGYGFVCQMLQLPIVMLQRTKWVRGKKTLNNVCFWCSMILGLSLICSLYVLV